MYLEGQKDAAKKKWKPLCYVGFKAQGQEDMASRLMMELAEVITWLLKAIDTLTKSLPHSK